MADKLKAPVFILVGLILVSLFFAGAVFNLLNKERAKNLALQEELEEVKTKQRITQTKLDESKDTISALQAKLQEAEGQVEKLNSQLNQEVSEKQGALGQIEQLKVDLEQQKSIRSDLENQLTQIQKDAQKLKARLDELESKKTELETKIKNLEAQVQQPPTEQGVELGKIVVGPSGETNVPAQSQEIGTQEKQVVASSLEGKILVVNRDYNFAVINLGSKDGVDIGNIFSVYHDNKYLGDIRIEKVHDSMAAADFVSAQMHDKVNEGDKVVQKTK